MGFELREVVDKMIRHAADCLVRRVLPIVDRDGLAVPGDPRFGQPENVGDHFLNRIGRVAIVDTRAIVLACGRLARFHGRY